MTMIDEQLRRRAIALYDRFTHEGMDRRLFISRMVALAGSVAAAEALIGAIAASPASASLVPPNDPRIRTTTSEVPVAGIPTYRAYFARPVEPGPRAAVLVVHENRGLNEHIRDVARRLALAGYDAVAPDFLSPLGGTPANEDSAREMIGKLDVAQSVAHAVRHLELLRQRQDGNGKAGAVGFCWGGAFVNRLAVAAGPGLEAAVPFYGPAPDPAEAVKVSAPMQLHLAGLDERVAKTAWPWVAALGSAGKTLEAYNYAGVHHAFHNDTSAERYDKAAASLAWARTLDFFRRYLG